VIVLRAGLAGSDRSADDDALGVLLALAGNVAADAGDDGGAGGVSNEPRRATLIRHTVLHRPAARLCRSHAKTDRR
jgi:hypothetical protein